MRKVLALLLCHFCVPAYAQWETTSYIPIPDTGVPYASIDYSQFFSKPAVTRGRINYGTADTAKLKAGALGVLADGFAAISYDSKKLAAAQFPPPSLAPLMESAAGDVAIPVYWTPSNSSTAWYLCNSPQLYVSSTRYPYTTLASRWAKDAAERQKVVSGFSAVLMHEVVHSIQERAGWLCARPSNSHWYPEGMANGLAHYLLSKRDAGALKKYAWARDERLYSKSLYPTTKIDAYASGSFFRYLIEATEVAGRSDLVLARDLIVKLTVADVSNRALALDALERILSPYIGEKKPAFVLANFHAELGSYSRRYGQNTASWIRRNFGKCTEFNLMPGEVQTDTISIEPNAAQCIKIAWENFDATVPIQLYAWRATENLGNLHLSEIARKSIRSSRFDLCYDVTRRVADRLGTKAERLCMLRRGATKAADTTVAWTSDFNMEETGHAYFVMTNAAERLANTQKITFGLSIGSSKVIDETGAVFPPRKKVPNPVKDGRTLMDSRVHAASVGPGRLLFDGRSVFGDGLDVGFLDGSPGAGEIDGSATIIRTGTYNVMLFKDNAGRPDGGAIVREPDGTFSGAIITLGMKGMPEFPSCGFKIPAELTIREQTREKLSFRVSGDVFNMSRETMSGQGSVCDRLRSAHVEFKAIDVSLPWSANYDGTATIERAYPPMQDIYDEKEFRSGPSFGGIATSRSIVFGDDLPEDDGTEESDQTSSPSSSNASSSANLENLPAASCNCMCPSFVHPPTDACFGNCSTALSQCKALDPLADTVAAQKADSELYRDLLQSQDLASEIRELLASDFATMSPETRRQIIRETVWEQQE